MEIFRVDFGEKILLVGEGNFSFSVAFINCNSNIFGEGSKLQPSVQIFSTCFESNDVNFECKRQNIELIKKKGCTVLQSVDATSLQTHPIIGCQKFTKIIFNFPHVGGKMKIHLNRKLLVDFFLSAKYVLNKSGIILVTLCDGQGGTGADKIHRRWDDTWKIVEMAAEADFILKKVFQFDRRCFPGYVNIGYRSLQKGFNTDNAIVHVFKLSEPPRLINLSDGDIQALFEPRIVNSPFGTLSIAAIHAHKISQDPFNLSNSPQKYLFDSAKGTSFDKEIHFVEENLIYGTCCPYSSADELIRANHRNLGPRACNSINIFKGLLLNELTGNFENPPVTCEVVCVGERTSEFAEKIVHKLINDFNFSEIYIISCGDIESGRVFYLESRFKIQVFRVNSCVANDCLFEICAINFDNIAKLLFSLDSWQELWADGSQIELKDEIMLYTPCLFPCTYTFDLSFSVCEGFIEQKFFNILWHLAANIIFSVELISVYRPLDKSVKHLCYRLKYKSYEVPLYRKRVIDIQRNVIGRTLERMLDVVIL